MRSAGCALVVVIAFLPCAGGRADDATSALKRGLDRLQIASAHAEAERFAEAVEELTEALADFERADNPLFLGLTSMLRGFCLHQLGRYADALPDCERAVELLDSSMAGDSPERAAATNQLALCLMRLGRGRDALDRQMQVLSMQRRLAGESDAQALAKALNDAAFCLLALGRPGEALDLSLESVAMGHRLHPTGHPGLTAALDNLASGLDDLGRHPEALVVREEALAMTRASHAGDHPVVAQSLANFAYTLRHLGRMSEARTRFEEALAIFKRLYAEDHREVATATNNLAMCILALGRPGEALVLQEEALAMTRRLHDGDHLDVAMLLHNLGSIRLEVGRLKEAGAALDEALGMRRRIHVDDHPDIARTLNDKAQCLKRMGKLDEAIELMREALAVSRRIESALTHQFAANLGIVFLREANLPAEAVPLFQEAIGIIEERRRSTIGLTALDRAAYLETLTHYRAYDGMVRAQLSLGRPDQAYGYLEQGRARSLRGLLEIRRIDPFDELRRSASALADAQDLKEIHETSEALRAADVEAGVHARSLAAARARRDLSRTAKRELVQRCTGALVAARKRQREMLRRRARLLQSGLPNTRPASHLEIQAMLKPDERLLAYSINDQDGVALLVAPLGTGIRGFELTVHGGAPLDEGRLASLVDLYLDAILDPRREEAENREELQRAGHELFRAVLPRALWKALDGVRRVYVVPHRALHRIPFEALVIRTGDAPQFWLDDGPDLAYGASGASLLWSRRRREEQRAQEPLAEAVALGDPIFAEGLVRLPGTRREVDAMRRPLDPTKVIALLGKDATEKALFAHASRARWLHLATHNTEVGGTGSLFGGLALTPPAVPTPDDDGCLRLLDLFERWRGVLDRCELVVLSACETQIGQEWKDEGVFALPLGFQHAGTPAVIASLWRVDDESTATLFSEFYRALRTGREPLVALADARRALRASKPQPYHWAPFVFLGAGEE